jgi:hypothetical protein
MLRIFNNNITQKQILIIHKETKSGKDKRTQNINYTNINKQQIWHFRN